MADENTTNNEGYEMKMPETTPPPAPAEPVTQAPAATTTPEPLIPHSEKHSRIAPVIGILIVILVLALGALYIWGAMLSKQVESENTEMATTTEEVTGAATENTAPPEESFNAMESEIDAEMNAFDTEMNEIDAELQTI